MANISFMKFSECKKSGFGNVVCLSSIVRTCLYCLNAWIHFNQIWYVGVFPTSWNDIFHLLTTKNFRITIIKKSQNYYYFFFKIGSNDLYKMLKKFTVSPNMRLAIYRIIKNKTKVVIGLLYDTKFLRIGFTIS